APAWPISSLRSKHNLKYWTGMPFYGIGCGAHSYDGIARWVNVLKTETYIERIFDGGNAIADRNKLSEADRAAEALFMGLRLKEGVSLAEFREEYGVDVIERYGVDRRRTFAFQRSLRIICLRSLVNSEAHRSESRRSAFSIVSSMSWGI